MPRAVIAPGARCMDLDASPVRIRLNLSSRQRAAVGVSQALRNCGRKGEIYQQLQAKPATLKMRRGSDVGTWFVWNPEQGFHYPWGSESRVSKSGSHMTEAPRRRPTFGPIFPVCPFFLSGAHAITSAAQSHDVRAVKFWLQCASPKVPIQSGYHRAMRRI